MSDREKVLQVAREWVTKAENDLKTAAHTLKLASGCPTDTVCFHVQQCIEKYMKALLVLDEVDFPKIHDLEQLSSLLTARIRLSLTPEELARLTDYATGARYPGWAEIPLVEARRAVTIARRARKEMRFALPRELLRRKKN